MTSTELTQIQADILAVASKIAAIAVPGSPASEQMNEKQLNELKAFRHLMDAMDNLKEAQSWQAAYDLIENPDSVAS